MSISEKPPKKWRGADDFQTPLADARAFMPYLPDACHVWEPFAGEGNIAKAAEEAGHSVTAGDILTGQDFFDQEPPPSCVLVSNPPYSLKSEILAHIDRLGIPFALLMPLTTLEGQKRQAIYRKGLDVLLLARRPRFYRTTWSQEEKAKRSSWFNAAWYCRELPKVRERAFGTIGV